MMIDTNNVVSITEANQNFSRIARMVDETGSVIIMKNNAPRYLLSVRWHRSKLYRMRMSLQYRDAFWQKTGRLMRFWLSENCIILMIEIIS